MLRALVLSFLAAASAAPAQESPAPAAAARPTVTVRQSGEADFVGSDDVALAGALERLRTTGGTLVIGPGRYPVRRLLFLPLDVVVRGEPGAVLALPSPARTAEPAEAGATELVLAGEHEFLGDTRVQILPPDVDPRADNKSGLELQEIARVEGRRLVFAAPLGRALPAGSRVGYSHKLMWVHKEGRATIEDLAFEGGRVESIPMPGHSQRCAIWASTPFGFDEKRLAPPGKDVHVRRCRFSDWYGRGVAFYNHEDGAVEGCTFERISDEAIDLDHFVQRFRIADNEVRDALWGIVLNDASRNVVERNRIRGCDIGIWSWQYELTPKQGINEENVIRGNVVEGARQKAIHIDKGCVGYVVEGNTVEGAIFVAEPEKHTLGENTQR